MKTAYYLDADGNHVAVTDETPKGPLKGFVFVGRRLVGEAVSEEAFGIDQVHKWKKVEIGDVPARCLELLGYDKPPVAPVPPPAPVVTEAHDEAHEQAHESMLDEGVKCRPVQYGPSSVSCLPFALGLILFVASIAFFYWLKHS